MTERSHYHFALTLTPPQYQTLMDTLTDLDIELADRVCRPEDGPEQKERDRKKLWAIRDIQQAILNQINAEPKV